MGSGEVVVLGCGLIGSQTAIDFLESSAVSKVTAVDYNNERLHTLQLRASKHLATGTKEKVSDKLNIVEIDVMKQKEDLQKILSSADLGVGALPYGISDQVVQAALESGIDFVDLIHSWRYEKPSTIDHKAKQAGITIIPACGFAPGLTNILAKYAADQMEDVDSIRIKVGAIPEIPKQPLNYKVVFSIDSVLEEYTRDALVVREGKKVTLPALSEIEEVTFNELPDQKFEAFITDGLSTLPETLRRVKFMEEKTIRWKGHVDQINLLMDLGFFSERPINLKTSGNRVSPRALLSTLMERKLAMHQGDKDMTLMRVSVQGRKRRGDKATRIHQYEMIDKFDSATQTTSMARTTSYPCSAVSLMLLEGKITETGYLPPELAIKDERFDELISRLERSGLSIKEREFLAG